MKKIAMISAALVGVGFGVEEAVQEAIRLAPRLAQKPTGKAKVGAMPRKGGDGLMAPITVPEKILTFADKKKGNVWNLSALALATGVDKNVLSTNLTHLVRKGVIRRTGRAEYCRTQGK